MITARVLRALESTITLCARRSSNVGTAMGSKPRMHRSRGSWETIYSI